MLFSLPKVFAAFLLCQIIFVNAAQGQQASAPQHPQARSQTNQTNQATPLDFREFFEPGAQELKPTAKLLGLNGRRVRMVGFMARLESAPKGAFYLCPRPTYGDESGGGTADLPVEHVRVIVSSAKEKEFPFTPRLIEVTGVLEVGNQAESDGTVSSIRLVLDAPPETKAKPRAKPHQANQKPQ